MRSVKDLRVNGSMGCCNRECFAADLAALCPDEKLRHKYFQMIINKQKLDEIIGTYSRRSGMDKLRRALVPINSETVSSEKVASERTSSTRNGLKEMIDLKIMVLEKGPLETICRRRINHEVGSTESVGDTLQWLVGNRQSLSKSRVFFNRGNDYKTSELLEINMDRFGNKKIRYFPTTTGTLSFVVDFANLINGSENSPFM
ncbi:unnamed protein product [Gongylonema pulchrum]|uniref:Uncharacterized protein n=1 Tax=Gongylonema pulchrum TaxID=637853 RepID=A0A183CZK9_9BILA|nr:unnamed protein product [Gongylonema pulchrum]